MAIDFLPQPKRVDSRSDGLTLTPHTRVVLCAGTAPGALCATLSVTTRGFAPRSGAANRRRGILPFAWIPRSPRAITQSPFRPRA